MHLLYHNCIKYQIQNAGTFLFVFSAVGVTWDVSYTISVRGWLCTGSLLPGTWSTIVQRQQRNLTNQNIYHSLPNHQKHCSNRGGSSQFWERGRAIIQVLIDNTSSTSIGGIQPPNRHKSKLFLATNLKTKEVGVCNLCTPPPTPLHSCPSS